MLPNGATLLGVTLSSDKTNISVMTGDRTAHPVLLSLANIHMDVRMKQSTPAFVLLALLPCPKFLVSKSTRGVLESRVVHLCLDIITHPLKLAARAGRMMADPSGFSHFCFTTLASYIVDTPEAALIAGVAGKTSHLTMADYLKFGDPIRHEPRTASTTLAQLAALAQNYNPLELSTYIPAAKAIRLNGVHLPFWRDWYLESTSGQRLLSDPCTFLTPEPLHHWHKQFWDHDVKWSIRAVGADEFDFRFTTIQPVIGFKYFKDGVSTLKQVTGRAHRDIERFIVCIIAGKAPPSFVIAIRALMDFRYIAQSRKLNNVHLSRITASLQLFHNHKQTILDIGARVGKRNKRMTHFQIPKLEFLHGVVPSIIASGAVMQWSADRTEHAHITEIKTPGRSGNNRSHNPQICRYLDRSEKHRNFSLALSICELQTDTQDREEGLEDEDPDDSTEDNHGDDDDDENMFGYLSSSPPQPDLFARANHLATHVTPSTPLPLRTQHTDTTAFQLNFHPSISSMTVDEVASKFKLPDLRPAIADYIRRAGDLRAPIFKIGQRRSSPPDANLPFTHLQVWYSVRMQMRTSDVEGITDPQRVCATPPSDGWPFGRYDTILITNGTEPGPGLGGTTYLLLPLWILMTNL
jgi:hypothetical protein